MLSDPHASKRKKYETCATCRFFFHTPAGNYGDCRRFPPSGAAEGFPTVNAFDWCGEFKEDEFKVSDLKAKEAKETSQEK